MSEMVNEWNILFSKSRYSIQLTKTDQPKTELQMCIYLSYTKMSQIPISIIIIIIILLQVLYDSLWDTGPTFLRVFT